jgi:hypothetical protein
MHLKDNAKQNKDKNNNNEHKQGTIEERKIPIYGCISLIVAN